jgi:hypothetical protein
MRGLELTALALAVVTAAAAPARAFDLSFLLGPPKSHGEVLLERGREARERGQHDLADALLADAELAGVPGAKLIAERAHLARDRGQLPRAAELFDQAAALDPLSSARVDGAAVLVTLGRWPEAVDALALAFDERGAALRADEVLVDARFAGLVTFAPFTQLVQAARDQQAGPIGRLLRKLERVEGSLRSAHEVLAVVWRWMGVVSRFVDLVGTSVVVLLALGIFLSLGITQLGLLRPPWPLAVGMLGASALWHTGARIANADPWAGLPTIGIALGVVALPFALIRLVQWLRRHAARTFDPLDASHLPVTVALAQEFAAAGHGAATKDRRELERTARSLAERLAGRVDSSR